MTIIGTATLQELRYLAAVAGSRHFGKAATACFVTQPTLSSQIKKLEEHPGVALLERTNKSVEVTPPGRKIVAMASRVIEQCKQIEQIAAASADPFVEPVRLGIIPTLGAILLALPIPEPELEVFRVFDEPFLPACPEGRPLAGRKRIHDRDLEAERLLLLAEGH